MLGDRKSVVDGKSVYGGGGRVDFCGVGGGGHDQGKELRGPGSWAEIGEAAAATGDEGEGGLHLRLRLSGAAVPTQAMPQSLRLWPAQAESPRDTLAPARLPSGAKGRGEGALVG